MAVVFDQLVESLLFTVTLAGDTGVGREQFVEAISSFYRTIEQATDPQHVDGANLLFSERPPRALYMVDDDFIQTAWKWLARHPDIEVRAAASSQDSLSSNASSRTNRLSESFRMYTNERRLWQAIAGHEIDHKRIPLKEFECLKVIARFGAQGCLQLDVTRLTGQDKRSVPKRTDDLCTKGYIVKEGIVGGGVKTTRLKLKAYGEDIRAFPGHGPPETMADEAGNKHRVLFYDDWYNKTIQLLQQNGGSIVLDDLRLELGILGKPWETKVYRRCWNRLVLSGLLRKVKAYVQGSKRPMNCLQLMREPKMSDRQLFGANKDRHEDMLEDGLPGAPEGFQQIPDNDEGFEGDDITNIVDLPLQLPSQWTPDLPFANLIFNVVESSGLDGLSSMDLNERTMGCLWRRPLDEIMKRLTDNWEVSQPPHLRHLTIVRDTSMKGKSSFYLYRTGENFERAVNAGHTAWEAVKRPDKASKKKGKNVHASASIGTTNDWGFPPLNSSDFLRYGTASLRECQRCVDRNIQARNIPELKYVKMITSQPINRETQAAGDSAAQTKGASDAPVTPVLLTDTETLDKNCSSAPDLALATVYARKPPSIVLQREMTHYKTDCKKRAKRLAKVEAERLKITLSEARIKEIEHDLLDRNKPGVYIRPPGCKELFLATKGGSLSRGRPPRNLLVVVKSSKLRDFPWFKDEIAHQTERLDSLDSSNEHGYTHAPPIKRKKLSNKVGQTFLIDSSTSEGQNEVPSKIVDRNLGSPLATNTNTAPFEPNPSHRPSAIAHSDRTTRTRSSQIVLPAQTVNHIDQDTHEVNVTPALDLSSTASTELVDTTEASHERTSFPDLAGRNEHGVQSRRTDSLLKLVPVDRSTFQGSSKGKFRKLAKGIFRMRRQDIIMAIMEKANRIYPGGSEIWYPFTTAWYELYQTTPDRHTVEHTLSDLCADGRLVKYQFQFLDAKGETRTSHIVALPEKDMDSPEVKQMQKAIIDVYPRSFIPGSTERSAEDHTHLQPASSFERSRLQSKTLASHKRLEDSTRPSQFVETDMLVNRTAAGQDNVRNRLRRLGLEPAAIEARLKTRQSHPSQGSGSGRSARRSGAIENKTSEETKLALLRAFDQGSDYLAPPTIVAIGEESSGSVQSPKLTLMDSLESFHNPTGTLGGVTSYNRSNDLVRSTYDNSAQGSLSQDDPSQNSVDANAADENLNLHRNSHDVFETADIAFFDNLDRIQELEFELIRRDDSLDVGTEFAFLNLGLSDVHVRHDAYGTDTPIRFIRYDGLEQTFHGTGWSESTRSNHYGIPGQKTMSYSSHYGGFGSWSHRGPYYLGTSAQYTMQQRTLPTNFGHNRITSMFNRRHVPIAPSPVARYDNHFTGVGDVGSSTAHHQFTRTSTTIGSSLTAMSKLKNSALAVYRSRKRANDIDSLQANAQDEQSHKRVKLSSRQDHRVLVPDAQLDDMDYDRMFIAIALAKLLCKWPYRGDFPWVFIQHAMAFKFDAKRLSKSWNQAMRRRNGESVVRSIAQALEEPFLRAYELGQLPTINFDTPENTDWPTLLRWAEKIVLPLERPTEASQRLETTTYLPSSQSRMRGQQSTHTTREGSMQDRGVYFTDPREYIRGEAMINSAFTIPTRQYNTKSRPIGDIELDQNHILLKSFARAIVMTDEKDHDAAKAVQSILKVSKDNIQLSNHELLKSKTFAQVKPNRLRPGRNFQIHSFALFQFKRWNFASDEVLFFQDVNAARQSYVAHFMEKAEMTYTSDANEAENLVLMNMVAQGHIELIPMQLERKDNPDAIPPTLSAWGWRNDKDTVHGRNLKFPLVYKKRVNFTAMHGLKLHVPVPKQSPIFSGESTSRIPFWIDVHGNLLGDTWHMVLRSMLNLLVFRAGLTAKAIEDAHNTKLWEWEILLALEWMETVGIADRTRTPDLATGNCRDGWKASEWWYCTFMPGVTGVD